MQPERTNGRDRREYRSSLPLEDHAHVVQAGDEGGAIDLRAAAGSVAETDDVGGVLLQSALEGNPLGVVDEGDEARLAVVVIAHEDCELAFGG